MIVGPVLYSVNVHVSQTVSHEAKETQNSSIKSDPSCYADISIHNVCDPICDSIFKSGTCDEQRRLAEKIFSGHCDAVCDTICGEVCDTIF